MDLRFVCEKIVYSVIVRQGKREWRVVIDYSCLNVDRMAVVLFGRRSALVRPVDR